MSVEGRKADEKYLGSWRRDACTIILLFRRELTRANLISRDRQPHLPIACGSSSFGTIRMEHDIKTGAIRIPTWSAKSVIDLFGTGIDALDKVSASYPNADSWKVQGANIQDGRVGRAFLPRSVSNGTHSRRSANKGRVATFCGLLDGVFLQEWRFRRQRGTSSICREKGGLGFTRFKFLFIL